MAISSTLDPYGTLGVPNDASPATIRSSYKKLMLQCHPDKVRDEAQRPEKAAQYEKVQQAYELLSDARRRRKYDEELARRGPAAAQASAAAGAAANGTSAGPSTPSAGRAPADEAAKAQKDRERQERHERRRRKQEEHRRASREEGSWNDHDKEARKSYQARHKAEQEETARASTHYDHEHRYKDDIPRPGRAYGSSSSSRYTTDDSPRKPSTYDRTPPPHGAPPTEARVPAQPDAEPVRPGYEETRAAEEAKLEAVRKKTREAQGGPSTPRTHRSNSREEDPHLKAHAPADYRQRMDEEREKDRSARKARAAAAAAKEATPSERMGRPTDIPSSRARKMSSSPLGRHGSSTVSRDDYGTTPPHKPPIFGGSVPTGVYYPGSPQATAAHPQVRRRHSVSSPSLEKQTSRLQRDQQTCDSGYSSPSPNTDAPITFGKKPIPSNLNPNPSPMVRNADG
jgi:curved DNA-binding protein CbpA